MEVLQHNRKAFHDYEIIDSLEVGIVLHGSEVKSLRDGKSSLDGSYAIIEKEEVWLINSHIDEYKNSNTFQVHVPKRKRKLLLHRSEIAKFAEKSAQKGFTLVPLDFHLTDGRVKVMLAVARGKQQHDKRASEKQKDANREIRNNV